MSHGMDSMMHWRKFLILVGKSRLLLDLLESERKLICMMCTYQITCSNIKIAIVGNVLFLVDEHDSF